MNSRGFARLGLLTLGLALSPLVVCDGDELLPATDSVASASIQSVAPIGNETGGVIGGYIATGTSAQYMGGGCERVRRPSCSRPGRRSTHR